VIGRREIEERVLGGLKERMLEPDLVSTFVEAFNEELRRHARTADAERTSTKRTLADVERKLSGIVRAIEDGAYNATLKSRLTVLETEKAELERKLAGLKAAPVVRLHSNLAELYRSKVATLVDALNEPDAVSEAGDILRSLIERIVLTPVEGVLRAELHGDLATLACFAQAPERRSASAGPAGDPALLSVVAGRGFEPLTFRL
jgi:site-specific DNA recombinase